MTRYESVCYYLSMAAAAGAGIAFVVAMVLGAAVLTDYPL